MNRGLFVHNISRGQGQSAVRAAAYAGRRRLVDERRGKTFNFSRRPGLAYSELRLPTGADPRLNDSGRLWNALETHLTRANARLAREIIIALPRGWALESQVLLVRGFLEDEFVGHRHAVDWHVHLDRPRNPHVHALISFPTLSAAGFGPAEANWDRRAWLVGLHAVWRRHCEHHGLSPGWTGDSCGFVHLGSAHALAGRGVITRQGQRLAALQALAARPRANRWPGWLRTRLRRRERSERSERTRPRTREDFERDR
ncbi:MAG TPA: MobA/MobL family protein [Acidiferrobacter sp.]|nr:MobA/MobL family protein [Acidiferrobacter sp.]